MTLTLGRMPSWNTAFWKEKDQTCLMWSLTKIHRRGLSLSNRFLLAVFLFSLSALQFIFAFQCRELQPWIYISSSVMCCPSCTESRKTDFTSNKGSIIPDSYVATHEQMVVLVVDENQTQSKLKSTCFVFLYGMNNRQVHHWYIIYFLSFVLSVMVYVKKVKQDKELRARIDLEAFYLMISTQSIKECYVRYSQLNVFYWLLMESLKMTWNHV